MKKKNRKRVGKQLKQEARMKAKMSENDKRAADKMEEMYKLYFSKVADARMSEDENALAFALMELGAKTTEWLDILTKDIEDQMKVETSEPTVPKDFIITIDKAAEDSTSTL